MTTDSLLHALGGRAHQRDGLLGEDPRWEQWAEGRLTDAEASALEAEASRTAEGRALLELYRPLETSFDERVMARWDAETRARSGREEQAPARSVEMPRRPIALRRPRLLASSLALSAAAAFAFWLAARPPALPAYVVSVHGGDRADRGAPAPETSGPVSLSPGSELDVTLRPDVTVAGPLRATAWLLQAGRAVGAPAPLTVAPSGAARLRGLARELFPGAPPGTYRLAIFVGDASALPADGPTAARMAGEASSRRVKTAGVDVVLLP